MVSPGSVKISATSHVIRERNNVNKRVGKSSKMMMNDLEKLPLSSGGSEEPQVQPSHRRSSDHQEMPLLYSTFPPMRRICLYFLILIVTYAAESTLSPTSNSSKTMKDAASFPENLPILLSQTDNFINKNLVKWAWGWTLTLLFAFILSKYLEKWFSDEEIEISDKITSVMNCLVRLSLATLVWFVNVRLLFKYVRSWSRGRILASYVEGDEKFQRVQVTGDEFDISGHCFLLSWSNFVIISEFEKIITKHQHPDENGLPSSTKVTPTLQLRVKKEKDELSLTCNSDSSFQDADDTAALSEFSLNHNFDRNKTKTKLSSSVLLLTKITKYALVSLSVIWDVMFLCTALFFHTLPEKLIGLSISSLSYLFFYKYVYVKLDM